MAGIILVALILINWWLYHKIFNVVYFNLGAGIWKELVGCFFVAAFELAFLMKIGQTLLKIVLVVALIAAAIIVVKVIRDKLGQSDNKDKKEEAKENTAESTEEKVAEPTEEKVDEPTEETTVEPAEDAVDENTEKAE